MIDASWSGTFFPKSFRRGQRVTYRIYMSNSRYSWKVQKFTFPGYLK